MTAALACINVTKAFDSTGRGVFDVSLAVPAGSVCTLLGPNGSGKTTMINLCLGFLEPDSGRIEIGGLNVAMAPVATKTRLAYVPEIARLYPHLSAFDHCAMFDSFLGHRHRRALHRSVLDQLRFSEPEASEPVRTYSKGMRQKVAIALGLLKGADVFLLDEPTSGLEPRSTAEFSSLVRQLKDEGKAFLLSTHDVAAAASLADHVVVLEKGRAVASGGKEIAASSAVL